MKQAERYFQFASSGRKMSDKQVAEATELVEYFDRNIPGIQSIVDQFLPGGSWYHADDGRTIDQVYCEALRILGFAPKRA